jgi:histidine triad (HIT) family protein
MGSEQDCIFCQIASGELDTEFVLETDTVVAFNDIAPAAPTHVLVVPKRHLGSVAELGPGEQELLAELIDAANAVASERGLDASGYRVLTNHGADAGQTVQHVHFHVLGGNALGPLG